MGGAALASWTNAGEPNRMARVRAAIRVFMISLHAESHLHGRRVTSHAGASRVKWAKSPRISAKRGHKGRCSAGCPRSVLVARHLDRGDEAIAAPRDIDNEPVAIASVTQHTAQCRNMDGEVGRLDKQVRPNPSHQLL